MLFDALVFDLDGTLWDATESCTLGWNNGLHSLNIDKTLTVDDIRRVTGKPVPVCVEILLPGEVQYHQQLLEVLGRFEAEAIKSHGGNFYDSLHQTIETLSRHHDLFLVSNCQTWYLDLFFELSGLKGFFKDFNCYGLSNQNKPEMLKNLKEKYGFINPAYIGDTETDEQSARSADYAFIYAGYGFGKAKNPDVTLNSLKELEKKRGAQ